MTINQLLRELEWSGTTNSEEPACPRCGAPGPGVLSRRYRVKDDRIADGDFWRFVEEYGGTHDEGCDFKAVLDALEPFDA